MLKSVIRLVFIPSQHYLPLQVGLSYTGFRAMMEDVAKETVGLKVRSHYIAPSNSESPGTRVMVGVDKYLSCRKELGALRDCDHCHNVVLTLHLFLLSPGAM